MDKKSSDIAKGIAIILVYIHHLFYSADIYGNYAFTFYPLSIDQTLWFSNYSKVCVAIFVFITAYGIMKQFMINSINERDEISRITIKRYIKLMMNYLFIYVISIVIFYKESNQLIVYGENFNLKILNMFIDSSGMANIFNTPTFNITWWYMSLAILLIFLIPVLIIFQKRFGNLILLSLTFLLLLNFNVNLTSPFGWYILSAELGLVLANNNFFEIIQNFISQKFVYRGLAYILSFVVLFILSKFRQSFGYLWITDALLAMTYCFISYIVISKIRIVSIPLSFIGKHSMNMFLTHTFIFYYYFRDITYSYNNSSIILLMLIITTLVVSIVIEGCKKVIRYDKLVSFMISKLNNFVIEKKWGSI